MVYEDVLNALKPGDVVTFNDRTPELTVEYVFDDRVEFVAYGGEEYWQLKLGGDDLTLHYTDELCAPGLSSRWMWFGEVETMTLVAE